MKKCFIIITVIAIFFMTSCEKENPELVFYQSASHAGSIYQSQDKDVEILDVTVVYNTEDDKENKDPDYIIEFSFLTEKIDGKYTHFKVMNLTENFEDESFSLTPTVDDDSLLFIVNHSHSKTDIFEIATSSNNDSCPINLVKSY